MKKIYLLLVLFGAFLLCACEKENIDPLGEDQTQLEESALKGAKKHAVPIKGNFVQEQTSYEEVPGGSIITMEGVGNVTHLGKTKLRVDQFWGNTNFPILEGEADVVFTAANGDELWADLYAYNSLDFVAGIATVTGGGDFAGGTGRFSNAEGPYELSAYYNLITKESEAFYSGEIMY